MILRWLTPPYPGRCCLWCQSTLCTAALEARNLKKHTKYISSTIIITDYSLLYHRLLAHTCCQEYTYDYGLLLCHRLARHALTRLRKNIGPGTQNPKSSRISKWAFGALLPSNTLCIRAASLPDNASSLGCIPEQCLMNTAMRTVVGVIVNRRHYSQCSKGCPIRGAAHELRDFLPGQESSRLRDGCARGETNSIGACILAAKAAASINPNARSATPLNCGLLAEVNSWVILYFLQSAPKAPSRNSPPSSIKLLTTIAVEYDLPIYHLDVEQAFILTSTVIFT